MDAMRLISPVTFHTNADLIYESPDKCWLLWALQDVVLWKVTEFQSISTAKQCMETIWEIFLSFRVKWSRAYAVIDITEVPILSPEIRQFLLDEWIHLIDRDDLTICLLDTDSFRRALRNSMSTLAGKRDRFGFYRDLDAAFTFINKSRESASSNPVAQEIKQIFSELVEQHRQLAAIHRQKPDAENDVEDSERHLQDLFEDFPGAVYYYDLLGRFQWGNKKAEELSGYNREEVIGKPYYKTGLLTRNDLKKLTAIFAGNLRKKRTGPHEFTLNRKDNTIRFIDVTAYLMSLRHKKILLCLANDVTERGLQNVFREASKREEKIAVICMHCNRIRDKQETWHEPSDFHRIAANILFSHSICPTCMKKNYTE